MHGALILNTTSGYKTNTVFLLITFFSVPMRFSTPEIQDVPVESGEDGMLFLWIVRTTDKISIFIHHVVETFCFWFYVHIDCIIHDAFSTLFHSQIIYFFSLFCLNWNKSPPRPYLFAESRPIGKGWDVGLHFGSKKTGKISIGFEDLSRHYYSNRIEAPVLWWNLCGCLEWSLRPLPPPLSGLGFGFVVLNPGVCVICYKSVDFGFFFFKLPHPHSQPQKSRVRHLALALRVRCTVLRKLRYAG